MSSVPQSSMSFKTAVRTIQSASFWASPLRLRQSILAGNVDDVTKCLAWLRKEVVLRIDRQTTLGVCDGDAEWIPDDVDSMLDVVEEDVIDRVDDDGSSALPSVIHHPSSTIHHPSSTPIASTLSLLHLAVHSHHPMMVDLLLSSGCDIERRDSQGFTPLHYAILLDNKQQQSQNFIVENNNHTSSSSHPLSPLDRPSLTIIHSLIDGNADVNALSSDGTTPLHVAIQGKNAILIQLLLSQPEIQVNIQGHRGVSPLLLACVEGYEAGVTLLVNYNNIQCSSSVIHHSSAISHHPSSGIHHPTSISSPPSSSSITHTTKSLNYFLLNDKNISCIFALCNKGLGAALTQVIEDLVKHHPLPPICDLLLMETSTGMTPLYTLCFRGYTSLIPILVSVLSSAGRANEVMTTLSCGWNPLTVAVVNGHADSVETLCQCVGFQKKGMKTMSLAVHNNQTSSISLPSPAPLPPPDISCRNRDGSTPLHHACEKQHTRIVSLLLQYGADVTIRSPIKISWCYLYRYEGIMSLKHPRPSSTSSSTSSFTPSSTRLQDESIHFPSISLIPFPLLSPLVYYSKDPTFSYVAVDIAAWYQSQGPSTILSAATSSSTSSTSSTSLSISSVTSSTPPSTTPLPRISVPIYNRPQPSSTSPLTELTSVVVNRIGATVSVPLLPLELAVYKQYADIVDILLTHAMGDDGGTGGSVKNHIASTSRLSPSLIEFYSTCSSPLAPSIGGNIIHQAIRDNASVEIFHSLSTTLPMALLSRNYIGITPLHLSSLFGNLDHFSYLFSLGCPLSSHDRHGYTVLHSLVAMLVETSVERGQFMNCCVTNVSMDIIMTLLCYLFTLGKQASPINHHSSSIIYHPSSTQSHPLSPHLLNARNVNGWTPLNIACHYGNCSVVALLLSHGADPNIKNNAGFSCLNSAANNGHAEVCRMLLKGVAACVTKDITAAVTLPPTVDVNSVNSIGYTPLMSAIKHGHVETVRVLVLESRTNLDYRVGDECGLPTGHSFTAGSLSSTTTIPTTTTATTTTTMTPNSLRRSSSSAMSLSRLPPPELADTGTNASQHILSSPSLLLQQKHQLLHILVNDGGVTIDQESTAVYGNNAVTVLVTAIMKSCAKTVEVLLSLGASVSRSCGVPRLSPLHWAASRGFVEGVTLLHQHHADFTQGVIDTRNYPTVSIASSPPLSPLWLSLSNMSPLLFTILCNGFQPNVPILHLLLSCHNTLHLRDVHHRSVFHLTARIQSLPLLKLLLGAVSAANVTVLVSTDCFGIAPCDLARYYEWGPGLALLQDAIQRGGDGGEDGDGDTDCEGSVSPTPLMTSHALESDVYLSLIDHHAAGIGLSVTAQSLLQVPLHQRRYSMIAMDRGGPTQSSPSLTPLVTPLSSLSLSPSPLSPTSTSYYQEREAHFGNSTVKNYMDTVKNNPLNMIDSNMNGSSYSSLSQDQSLKPYRRQSMDSVTTTTTTTTSLSDEEEGERGAWWVNASDVPWISGGVDVVLLTDEEWR